MLEREVQIPIEHGSLAGTLGMPDHPQGIVIFSHGSGSSRFSPRNRFVAEELRRGGMATLLFDLLTAVEDREYARRFDINLLTQRLATVTQWAQQQPAMSALPVGLFGASTGSASALRVAAQLGPVVHAVVSRGGRPDLAEAALPHVYAPTLLIVGGQDALVLELNQSAYAELPGVKELHVVRGATHLFEEPGALEEVARLATDWFQRYLQGGEQETRRWKSA